MSESSNRWQGNADERARARIDHGNESPFVRSLFIRDSTTSIRFSFSPNFRPKVKERKKEKKNVTRKKIKFSKEEHHVTLDTRHPEIQKNHG